ncbi:MAG: cation-translocating P-type ATPase [Thermodesulfobacteriota bacterium]
MTFHDQSAADVIREVASSASGLSEAEAQERLAKVGPNRLTAAPPPSLLVIFLNQFRSFIIYILLFAIVFSLLIGEYADSLIILAILFLNGAIGFFQEHSANKSLAALKRMTRVQATVVRDGTPHQVVADDLVPGDLILLESGSKVPADARLLTTVHLQVDESPLTGESVPVSKEAKVLLPAETGIADQHNMVFSSTSVVAGRGQALVTATAMATEIGKISRQIQEAGDVLTPLQRRLDRFGRKLGLVIIGICLIVLGVLVARALLGKGDLNGSMVLEMAFIAIALAVAAVPTALPAVVTISLAVGVKRLLAKGCLVRRLAAVETLGSCDIICSDKTGTLTENKMTVVRGWSVAGETICEGSGYEPVGELTGEAPALLFEIGLWCNNATLTENDGVWQLSGDPTEGALLVSGRKAGISKVWQRQDELPFDSQRKLMSVLLAGEEGTRVYSKGAPDQLLACCDRIMVAGRVEPLTAELAQEILAANERYAGEAMRVLAMAWKEANGPADFSEQGLIMVGLQAMIDPPRADVAHSLSRATVARVRSIMITGDYPATAAAVAATIGISGESMSGAEMDGLSDGELAAALATGTNIFARVVPAHKQRIVTALQEQGHVVAMTGDGVNDAPALKQADIGVAVGSGTEVAKEAADFVLLKDSFSHIVDAVAEGRGIYDNIQKSIMLLLSGNLGEVLIIFLAVISGMNLPLTAVLLLWINMVTDGAPALAYSVDPYSRGNMTRAPIPLQEGILPRPRLQLLAFLGLVGTVIGLLLFAGNGGWASDSAQVQHGRTLVFSFVVCYEMLLAFIIRRHYQVPLFANPLLWLAVTGALLLQLLVIYTPLAPYFGVVPLDLDDLALLGLGALAFLGAFFIYQGVVERAGR